MRMRPLSARALIRMGALSALTLLGGCDRKAAEPPPVRPVLSLVVAPKPVRVSAPFIGTVQPRYQTTLGFRASGRMVSRTANVGDRVTKGELLASLDPVVVRFALMSAQADVANAEAQQVNASATEARARELLKTQAVSQAQVDADVASRDMATAKLNQAQASLTKAQEQFGYSELHSDYDGVITSWSLEVGQVVSAGQTVVTVARPEARDAVFDVPDDLLDKVPAGGVFSVVLQSDETVAAGGEVREIAPQADAATRTRRIRLTLKDPPDAFRLGTTVAIVLSETQEPTITLPESAILDQGGKAQVWLVTVADVVELRPVVLGARDGASVTVARGLAAGDRVVTAGVHSLSNGQPVKHAEP